MPTIHINKTQFDQLTRIIPQLTDPHDNDDGLWAIEEQADGALRLRDAEADYYLFRED